MHMKQASVAALILAVLSFGPWPAPAVEKPLAQSSVQVARHTFTAGSSGQFLLDGQAFQIRAGSMHYPRVPRAYWRDRMRKMKAMGLNTLTTYVFWNVHETAPGIYDFTGQNDLAEYLKEAQEEGLYVILRPGPYVCAEWEFGGFPAWLLKRPGIQVRSRDPQFMAAVSRWFRQLGGVVHPMMFSQGGPIIAVQVENEYGSFGNDHAYMESIEALLKSSGMGDGYLYTADGPAYLKNGSIPGLPAVVNFGPGEAQNAFVALKAERPSGPMMSGEYWDGWFDHWGQVHQTRPPAQQEQDLAWMLQRGYSFNLYMAEGGTSFGWMNGANSDGKNYEPDTTDYDYDVAIDERGGLRPKFFTFRDLIAKSTGQQPAAPPAPTAATTYSVLPTVESASLWTNLPEPVRSAKPLCMKDLDQAYGYILYTSELRATSPGELTLDRLHDYAVVFLNHQRVGVVDRRLGQGGLTLPAVSGTKELEILVENTGRVNYTVVMRGERKGITSRVTLNGKDLTDWKIYSLPMHNLADLRYKKKSCEGPCFFRTRLMATAGGNALPDTFLNTTGVHQGMVWANDRTLGRAWEIGPETSLYLPGPWLHRGPNNLFLFDALANGFDQIGTVDHPTYIAPAAIGTATAHDN
jgi:beta-galactosidase